MLDKTELTKLYQLYIQICKQITQFKTEESVAAFIQYPKFPTAFSESLVAHLLLDGKVLPHVGPFVTATVDNKAAADVVAKTHDGRLINVEVKATGSQEFITMGEKDYTADYLIWLRIENEMCIITQCQHPIEFLPWRKNRVTLNMLKKDYAGELITYQIPLTEALTNADTCL